MNFKTFFSPALILSLGTFGSYILGVIRDIFFARSYGATEITDTYFSAFLIPDILLMICVSSALLGIAVPLFMQKREKNNREGYILYGNFFTVINIIFISMSFLGIIFAPEIFSFLDHSRYLQNPNLLIDLARIFFLSNICFGISNFLGSFLMAHNHFFSTSLAPLFYNIGITFGIIFFSDDFGIYAAGYGALCGAFTHLLSRIIEYFYHEERFPISYDFSSPQLKELAGSMVFRWITVASLPLLFWVFSKYSSYQEDGLYTIFSYTRNLESAPVMIFGFAISTSVFPLLSKKFAEKNTDEILSIFWSALYKILFWTIPMSIGIFFLGNILLGFVYDLQDNIEKIEWIKNIISIIAFAIPFESLSSLFARTFNAMGDTKTPLKIVIFSLCSSFFLLFFFFLFPLFPSSIVLGFAYLLGNIVNVIMSSYYLFSLDIWKKNTTSLFFPYVKILRKGFIFSVFATVVMGSVFYILQNVFQFSYFQENNNSFILNELLIIPVLAGVIYCIIMALFWRKDTLRNIKRML